MFFDLLVQQRLRDGWIIDLAVSVAAIADQIDDHVSAEFVAILHRHPSDANHRVDILSVYMEDRNRLAPRNAGSEPGRMLFEITGSESEEIIHHHMNRAADGVALEVGIVHGFGQDALSSKRCVPVDQ